MTIRLKLSVLTMIAGLATTFSGCGDDDDNDDGGSSKGGSSSKGGEAGDGPSTTGGKSTTGGTSSGEGGADPGEGGASPSGGTTGGGGEPSDGGDPGTATGGTGGTSGGTCEYPQCLADLQATCVPEGECIESFDISDPMNPSFAICWENGVKAGLSDFSATSGTFAFQKDGETCYTLDMTFNSSGDVQEGVYKDADGNTVATMTLDQDGETQTIECEESGEVVVYTPSSCPDPEPGTAPPEMGECTMGECTLD